MKTRRNFGRALRDSQEFAQYLKYCTDAQVRGVYEKEKAAGRQIYVALAEREAASRGISIKSGAQS